MSSTEYMKTPFDPHQCLWTYEEEDGRRCRAYAEHNKFFCCQHNNEVDGRLTIIPTRTFHLPSLDNRINLQAAITLIAERLAARLLDDRTAKLLLKSIHYALQNLQAQKKEQRQQEREAKQQAAEQKATEQAGERKAKEQAAESNSSQHPPIPPMECHSEPSAKNPRSSPAPEPSQDKLEQNNTVILSEARSAESKDLPHPPPTTTAQPFSPENPTPTPTHKEELTTDNCLTLHRPHTMGRSLQRRNSHA